MAINGKFCFFSLCYFCFCFLFFVFCFLRMVALEAIFAFGFAGQPREKVPRVVSNLKAGRPFRNDGVSSVTPLQVPLEFRWGAAAHQAPISLTRRDRLMRSVKGLENSKGKEDSKLPMQAKRIGNLLQRHYVNPYSRPNSFGTQTFVKNGHIPTLNTFVRHFKPSAELVEVQPIP